MGIFSSIKDAIFGKDAKAKEAPRTPSRPASPTPRSTAKPSATARPAPLDEVDVAANLDARAGADKLNWRTSIVDLLKLLDLDSGFGARKELATEMGDKDYSGTAEENIWLHRQVMNKLAANGGRVPADLRD